MIKSKSSRAGDWVIVFVCIIIILICLLPLLNVAARSLSSANALFRNEVLLLPVGLNFDAYTNILSDARFLNSMGFTAILTLCCTALSMFMTIICAYPLMHDNLKGRKFFNSFIIITMYFSAGTIPNYLLMKDLNFLESPLALAIPGCLSVFNMIIMRSFFYGVPDSLRESAELDGAGPIRILISIYLPLSTSVLATLSLFYAVGRWNGFSDALMYITTNRQYFPIQLLLYQILQNLTSVEAATQEGFTTPGVAESTKAGSVMIATIPILLVYPFLQKYFIAGVTIGAVKG